MDARKPTDIFDKLTKTQLKTKATSGIVNQLTNAFNIKPNTDISGLATLLTNIANGTSSVESKQAAITISLERLAELAQTQPKLQQEVINIMTQFASNMTKNNADKEIYYRALLQISSKNESIINQIPQNDIVAKLINRENDPVIEKIINDTQKQLITASAKQADMIKDTLVFLQAGRSNEDANESSREIAHRVLIQYFNKAKEMMGPKEWDKINKEAQAEASVVNPEKAKALEEDVKKAIGSSALIMATTVSKVSENPIEKLAKPEAGNDVKKSEKPQAIRHHHKHHHKQEEKVVSQEDSKVTEHKHIKAKH